eukprot:TRINITY_DN8823_c0_g1_i3.p1 TRINITY_DN8823_c0_g1~~TRINITY_DN8823_c0_g1_i3.p1  ORF type:complete len:470 (+),score=118.08 TRINITY_DN8823_c0_g1_i3:64-1473(+)
MCIRDRYQRRVHGEYIENLLKQIHYMNLEVNLIKEKQSEEKGMIGINRVGKDGNPIYDDFIFAENKYEIMRKKLEEEIHDLEIELLKRRDENQAIEKLRDDLREMVELREKGFMDYLQDTDQKLTKLKQDLRDDRNSRESLEAEMAKLNDTVGKLKAENDRLHKEKEKRDMMRKWEDDDFSNDVKEQLEQMEFLKEVTKKLEDKEQATKEKFYENESSKKKKDLLLSKQTEMFSSINEAARLRVEVEELEVGIDFLSQKLEDFKEVRRKCIGEQERYSQLLEDARKANQLRIDRKKRENANPEIAELQSRIITLQRENKDVNTKLEKHQERQKQDQLQQLARHQAIKKLEEKKDEINKQIGKIQEDFNNTEPELIEKEKNLEGLQTRYEEIRGTRNKKRKELDHLNAQFKELKSRYDYLSQNVDLEEELKAINVERLTGVVKNNESVNYLIEDLLKNYQKMRQYAHQNK